MSMQFKETLNLLKSHINYTRPLSYDEWLDLPDDHKVGALFVQFYDQISLAWYKLKTKAAIEEECVSEVFAYLSKNVYGESYQQVHSRNVKKAKARYTAKNPITKMSRVDCENLRRAKLLHNDEIIETEVKKAIELHSDEIYIHFITTGRLMLSNDSLISLLKPNERMSNRAIIKLLKPTEVVTDADMLCWLEEDGECDTLRFDPHTTKITEKTFTPSYMYRVASNCIYCKSIDPYKGQTAQNSWYNNTTSNIVIHGDDTLDLFDTIPSHVDLFDQAHHDMHDAKFWSLIENQDDDTLSVVEAILNGESCPLSEEKQHAVIVKLRGLLSDFKHIYS